MLVPRLARSTMEDAEYMGDSTSFNLWLPDVFNGTVTNCTGYPLQLSQNHGNDWWGVQSSSYDWRGGDALLNGERAVLLNFLMQDDEELRRVKQLRPVILLFDPIERVMVEFYNTLEVWKFGNQAEFQIAPLHGITPAQLATNPRGAGHNTP